MRINIYKGTLTEVLYELSNDLSNFGVEIEREIENLTEAIKLDNIEEIKNEIENVVYNLKELCSSIE